MTHPSDASPHHTEHHAEHGPADPAPTRRERTPGPLSRDKAADLYFMEHRAKLIDIAAFLDRLDRAGGQDDHRVAALRKAIAILAEDQPARARRILDLFSDPTAEPIERAPGKGADGAWAGPPEARTSGSSSPAREGGDA